MSSVSRPWDRPVCRACGGYCRLHGSRPACAAADVCGLGDVIGRLLACTRCSALVDVLEADLGAPSDRHEWIAPTTYVCGDCLTAAPVEQLAETLGDATDVDRRAA